MRKLTLVFAFISLSNNVHASDFDFCRELNSAIETCSSKVQELYPDFDAYISECDVREAVFDKVNHVFIPIKEKSGNVIVEALGNTQLRFKFSKCLKEHLFSVKFN